MTDTPVDRSAQAALEKAREIQSQKNQIETAIQDANLKADRIRDRLTRHVHDISNPSPAFVVACVAVLLLILYMIYILFLKPSPSGLWVDSNGNRWKLDHHTWYGEISMRDANGVKRRGQLDTTFIQFEPNALYPYTVTGFWNLKDRIIMVRSSGEVDAVLHRV